MNTDELLKLLDLSGTAPAALPEEPLAMAQEAPSPPAAAAGPTALDLDDWGRRRGRDLLAESDRLQKLGLDADAVADFHGCAFEPDPVLAPACVDARRHAFVSRLLETPDYRALHASTRLNPAAAEIAAAAFAEQFAALTKKTEPDPAAPAAISDELAVLRAVGKAVAAATSEVEELIGTATAFGLGPGLPGSNDPHAIAALFRRVRADPALKRVCDLAGRFRRLAQGRQRKKAAHGLDDVVGVTIGGDVSRLLPAETVRLADPVFEDEVLRRLVERQCLCREHRAVEPVGKGPILVSVDESGSMQGEKVHTAKALALALAWVARHQKRWCGLVAYSGASGERLLALPPGRWDEGRLADWLTAFLGGGSDLDVPLAELPDYYRRLGAPAGTTDVVLVTDARCRVPADLAARFNAWKARVNARVLALVIGGAVGDLAAVCDEVYTVPALDVTDPAVGRVLSL